MSQVPRRQFLSATSAFLAMAAIGGRRLVRAQQTAHRPYRIALVPDLPGPYWKPKLKVLTDSLRGWGRMEGRDYAFYHSGVPYGPKWKLAVERALQAKPDLMVIVNLGYGVEAYKHTRTIPLVLWAAGFPVAAGVAKSLARPGTNVTGCTIYGGGEFFGKLLDLLHQAKPDAKRVGFFMSYVPPFHPRAEADLIIKGLRDAATAIGIDLRTFEIAKPEQVDVALTAVTTQGIDAVVCTSDPAMSVRRTDIMRFMVAKRLLTIGDQEGWEFVKPASVLTYRAPLDGLAGQIAPLIEKILWEGANPGDLPIELPTRYTFDIHMKTAKAIGLRIPESLLIQANKVVE